MREKLLHPATIIATCALLVALGGSGYAISQLPKNSVGTKQLKTGAVTSAKVKDGSLLARDFKAGQVPTGLRGERGAQGERGPAGPAEGPAGGALAGAYPNPRLATDALGTSRAYAVYGRCVPATTVGLNSSPAVVDSEPNVGFYLDNSFFGVITCPLGVPPGARASAVDVRYRNNTAIPISATVYCPNFDSTTQAFTVASDSPSSPAAASASLRTLRVTITGASCPADADMYLSVLGTNDPDRTLAAYRVYYALPG